MTLVPGYAAASFEDHRRAQIAGVTLALFTVACVGLAAISVPAGNLVRTGILAALAGLFGGLLTVLRSGRGLRPISMGLVVTQVLASFVTAWFAQGAGDMQNPWMVLPTLFAFFLLGPRSAWLTATATVASMVGLFLLERNGLYTPPVPSVLRSLEFERLVASASAIPVVLLVVQLSQREHVRERERDEAERQRAHTVEVQRGLWHLAGGLAHEVNNPLAAVTANLSYVKQSTEGCGSCGSEPSRALDDSIVAAQRIGVLIADLRLVMTLANEAADQAPLAEVARRVAGETPVTIAPGRVPMIASPTAVERMVQELLHNVRSVIDGGNLKLIVRAEGAHSWLELHDDVPGRMRCEFPVSQALVLHAGGQLVTEQRVDGNTVRVRLPSPA
jgi:signal transduction histidine kinase